MDGEISRVFWRRELRDVKKFVIRDERDNMSILLSSEVGTLQEVDNSNSRGFHNDSILCSDGTDENRYV